MKTTSLKMKLLIIFTSLLMVVSIIATIVVSMPETFAVWVSGTGESHAGREITTEIDSIWGKYFIYSINEDNTTYSIVGYKNGCVEGEMIIPTTIPLGATIRDIQGNETKNNQDNTLHITKIKNTLNNDGKLGFIINKLIINENILEIEDYTFCMMDELVNVDFYGKKNEVKIGTNAFKNCNINLAVTYDGTTTLKDLDNQDLGTKATPWTNVFDKIPVAR